MSSLSFTFLFQFLLRSSFLLSAFIRMWLSCRVHFHSVKLNTNSFKLSFLMAYLLQQIALCNLFDRLSRAISDTNFHLYFPLAHFFGYCQCTKFLICIYLIIEMTAVNCAHDFIVIRLLFVFFSFWETKCFYFASLHFLSVYFFVLWFMF